MQDNKITRDPRYQPLQDARWSDVDWPTPETAPPVVYPAALKTLYEWRMGKRISSDELHAALEAEDVDAALDELRAVVAQRENARRLPRTGSGGYFG